MRVAIVGGSIVGPALALILTRAGIDCDVYEATPETVPQSGGVVGLDHASLGVLDRLGIDQNQVVPYPSERVVAVKVRDRKETGRTHTIYPGRNTTWTLMHRVLRRLLPDGTYTAGEKVVDVTVGDDRRARIHHAGHTSTADLVAFTDGRRSTGRKILDPARKLRYAGYVGFRGIANQVSSNGTDWMSWRPEGTQFNAFPVHLADGSHGIDWTYYVPATEARFVDWFGVAPGKRGFILPHQMTAEANTALETSAEQVLPAHLIDLVHATATRMAVPISDIDEPDRAVHPVGDSRAVLLGDALAPVRPHTARGLNNGLMAADGLATVLRQHARWNADLDAGLDAWQNRLLPQVIDTIRLGPQLAQRIGIT